VIELRRGRVLRIGHRGAAALAPENTLESIQAALDAGVDLVELDVRLRPDGTPVLAHDRDRIEAAITLADALERLADSEAGLLLDLKCRGCEEAVVSVLRRHGFLDRTVIASFWARSLHRLAAIEPALPRALSYPEDRLGLAEHPALAPLVRRATATLRLTLSLRIGRWLDRTGALAASLHVDVVSASVIERCHARGAAVFAWTVNDPVQAFSLSEAGLDAIITDDPRIFSGWEA
jgi:glycerophosphoryl diester phosphodiesterase